MVGDMYLCVWWKTNNMCESLEIDPSTIILCSKSLTNCQIQMSVVIGFIERSKHPKPPNTNIYIFSNLGRTIDQESFSMLIIRGRLSKIVCVCLYGWSKQKKKIRLCSPAISLHANHATNTQHTNCVLCISLSFVCMLNTNTYIICFGTRWGTSQCSQWSLLWAVIFAVVSNRHARGLISRVFLPMCTKRMCICNMFVCFVPHRFILLFAYSTA